MQELNALDAAIGDGDHGTTLVRGLTRAAAAEPGRRAQGVHAGLGRRVGGRSSGWCCMKSSGIWMAAANWPAGWSAPVPGSADLGEVQPGDKSLVDSLAPAAGALADGKSLAEAVSAAEAGRDATRDMRARCGRAQHVEGGGAGHLDPGAVSLVLILETLSRESVS